MGTYLDANAIMAMLPQPNTMAPATTAPPPPMPPVATTQPPFVPSPQPPPQQQPVNIQLTVAKDQEGNPQRDTYGRPVYVPVPAYGPGYGGAYPVGIPGLPGGIGTYPGVAGDASIRIGSINSSLSQGNTNWAGEQSLGAVFPTPSSSPASTPPPPPPTLTLTPPPPFMDFAYPMPSGEVTNGGPGWKSIALLACVCITLAVAGWLLYTRYIRPKQSTNANAASTNTNTANRNRNRNIPDLGDEFGDFDAAAVNAAANNTAPPARRARRS